MMIKRPYESRGALTRTVSGSACGDASRRQASSLLMISVRKLRRERCDTANSPKELASLRLRIDSLTQIARRCSHATKDDVRTAIAVAGFGVSSWSRGGVHAGWFIAAAAAGLASICVCQRAGGRSKAGSLGRIARQTARDARRGGGGLGLAHRELSGGCPTDPVPSAVQ